MKSAQRLLAGLCALTAAFTLSACGPISNSAAERDGSSLSTPENSGEETSSSALKWADLQVQNLLITGESLPADALMPTPERRAEDAALPGKSDRIVESDPENLRELDLSATVEVNPVFPFEQSARGFNWSIKSDLTGSRLHFTLGLGQNTGVQPSPLTVDTKLQAPIRIVQAVAVAERLYTLVAAPDSNQVSLWMIKINTDGNLGATLIHQVEGDNFKPVQTSGRATAPIPSLAVTQANLYVSAQQAGLWQTTRFHLDVTGKVTDAAVVPELSGYAGESIRVLPAGKTQAGFVRTAGEYTQFGKIEDGQSPVETLRLRMDSRLKQVRILGDTVLLALSDSSPRVWVTPATDSAPTSETVATPEGEADPLSARMFGAEQAFVLITPSRREAIRVFSPLVLQASGAGQLQDGFIVQAQQAKRTYRFLLEPSGEVSSLSPLAR
ncbi:hypothetical protein [Boudabousia marimammalium]|uniref:GerMN domain-containing protein n=1 Tax=Boudabousia marimammalium TaxID=156892 RepID=A0A1Q5PMH9_9ACTO|nr:hypothetical protein [Boudabousia marimammalium]OKL48685.1 hypothetical protein BM477_05675 [Boudabousia marimammalium]